MPDVLEGEAWAQGVVLREIPVAKVRTEEGLSRRRDAEGHRALRESIDRFGVLTPIAVRKAPGSGDYLLVKGQGRTLACSMLGIKTIPALVLPKGFSDLERVQQFLVENVARLKMTPADRALLIVHARSLGEETKSVARRFGVAATTVRRLEAQIGSASRTEITALRAGKVSLSLHGVLARHASSREREPLVRMVEGKGVSAAPLDFALRVLSWRALEQADPQGTSVRLTLFRWLVEELVRAGRVPQQELLLLLGERFPEPPAIVLGGRVEAS